MWNNNKTPTIKQTKNNKWWKIRNIIQLYKVKEILRKYIVRETLRLLHNQCL